MHLQLQHLRNTYLVKRAVSIKILRYAYLHLSTIKFDSVGRDCSIIWIYSWRWRSFQRAWRRSTSFHTRRKNFSNMYGSSNTTFIHIFTISIRILSCWVIHNSKQEERRRRNEHLDNFEQEEKNTFPFYWCETSYRNTSFLHQPVFTSRFGPICKKP